MFCAKKYKYMTLRAENMKLSLILSTLRADRKRERRSIFFPPHFFYLFPEKWLKKRERRDEEEQLLIYVSQWSSAQKKNTKISLGNLHIIINRKETDLTHRIVYIGDW